MGLLDNEITALTNLEREPDGEPQQQTFGACNGCDQPDDSGPIAISQIRLSSDAAGVTGEHAFQQDTTKQFVVTLELVLRRRR